MFTSKHPGGGSWCNFKFFGWNFDQKNFWVEKKKRNEQTDEQTDKQTDEQTDEQMAQLPEPKEGLFFDGFEI